MYEYVRKSEYAPIKKELEKIIKSVQIQMREKYGLIFWEKITVGGVFVKNTEN